MHRITIDTITVICTDKEVQILEKILVTSINDVTTPVKDNNIEITFGALNRPLGTLSTNLVCHVPDKPLLSATEADKYIQDTYGCYFIVAEWVSNSSEFYKEYTDFDNVTFIGSGKWGQNDLTLEQNSDRLKMIEAFQDHHYNGIFSDQECLRENDTIITLEQALNICEEWQREFSFLDETPSVRGIYTKYRHA